MSFYSISPFIKEYYPEYYTMHEYPQNMCVSFNKVADQWGVFSNFANTPIIFNCVEYKSAEQLFQCLKFVDEEARNAVYVSNNPKMTAKHWEKTHRREDWGAIVLDVMKFCLQLKYEQSEDFRDALTLSKGKIIVEDETSRKTTRTGRIKDADTWGVVLVDNIFVGSNLMGRLLMELRDNGGIVYHLPNQL